MVSVALTIAGSDPSGGAGMQADLKTFHQHGVYGTSVITLLTVQDTQHVHAVQPLATSFVRAQLDTVLADVPPIIAKTGALGTVELIELIASAAADFGFPLIVDPVMVSKHGDPLLPKEAAHALKKALVPHAFLITPNVAEAAVLAEMEIKDVSDMEKAAAAISLRGVPNVLITGGRLAGQAVDVLYADGDAHRFAAERIDTPHTHGTGCVYSAAITARLARGESLTRAVQGAKSYITQAISSAPQLGSGVGPVNMLVDVPPITP